MEQDELMELMQEKLSKARPWTASPSGYEANKFYALYQVIMEQLKPNGRE